jgi:hypothetical protein
VKCVPQESNIMNTLSDNTNIENDTEVIFVHALNRSTFVSKMDYSIGFRDRLP